MSRKLTAVLALLLVALAGCQKTDGTLALKLRSKYLSAEAGGTFLSVTAESNWTLRVEFPAGEDPWASVKPESGSGSQYNVILSYEANPADEARQVTLVLTSATGSQVRESLSQNGKTADAVVGNYGYDVAPMDWLELPACVEGDGREVLVHNMSGTRYRGKDKDTEGRNWTCYYDYAKYESVWVAYPLNSKLIGSGTRTNKWGYDPVLPDEDAQQSITRYFSSTKRYYSDPLYDRGHQIPSADRLTYGANVSTFYPTNMTPQSNAFNANIWATLEGKVRGYAKLADTLYVVTGCLMDNAVSTVKDVAGHTLPVPTAYFKALLYKGPSAPASTGNYMMAGFLLPHSDAIANGKCADYRLSIDDLERQTGIDFFPNLERRNKDLALQLEAAEPDSAFWQ